ncbi:MAG TPA: XdhC family protein [Bacteroidota bacterium]|nr:XdhC family protein [Bacteroidota bacterium]
MRVFEEISRGLREGRKLYLATIIRSSGSVPAPLHSRMLVTVDRGPVAKGTVGGGCLDGAVMRTVAKGLPEGAGVLERFRLDDEFGETEFTCGGSVEILTEALTRATLPLFEKLLSETGEGRDCVVLTAIRTDGTTLKSLYRPDGSVVVSAGSDPDPVATAEIVRSLDPRTTARTTKSETEERIFEFIESAPPLVIFGGGHVGRAVALYAAAAGFSVTVVDDRPEFAGRERFPGARAVVCERFDTAMERVSPTGKSYVVIVTRGHRHDEAVLGACMRFSPKYVGMIGSRRKVSLTFGRLEKEGISKERLATVHAPIGMPIGARTAEEIGISIVAELIAVRRSAG